ncbi:hypothetical protein MUO65_08420 [bacterium]|jgi:hypothetical protein|nr:hypothetical protein [bacterium]
MKEKVVISLNQEEQIELERITADGDEKQALEFLKEVVKKKVDKANAPGCKPVFEWLGKEPQILTEMKAKTKNKNSGRRKSR